MPYQHHTRPSPRGRPQLTDNQRPKRAGRPLDASRDAAILQAAIDGLTELGYDRLSMEEIAVRARAGKGALYRRWPSKAALVVDAIARWREARVPSEPPDTGSLAGDIAAIVDGVPDFDQAARQQLAVFIGAASAAARDPELKAAISEHLLQRPRRVLAQVLERAVARGEIPADRDLELLPEIVIALNCLRMLLGDAPDREHVGRVLETVIYPLATGEPIR